MIIIINRHKHKKYRNKYIHLQVQSVFEAVYRYGHKLVYGNSVMAVQECAAECLVSHRLDKYPARSHYFHYFRVEREDQATAAEAIWLPESRSIF